MTISGIDWAIVAAYFLLSAAIGLYFTRRGGESLDQYFLSGRQAPWWLAGTAMVATSVAAGMWAVLWTDLVQFVIKMSAVIILAVYAADAVGGIAAMKTKLVQHFGSEAAAL